METNKAYNKSYLVANNLLAISLIAWHYDAYAAKSDLVIKKKELPKIFSVYTIDTWSNKVREAKPLSFFLNLTFSKMRLAYFNYFCIAQTIKFLLNNNTMSYIIYYANTTNKANIDLFSIKCKHVISNIRAAKLKNTKLHKYYEITKH